MVNKPLVARDGTNSRRRAGLRAAAVSRTAKESGRTGPIDAYGPATSVVALGVAAGTLLIDGQTSPGGPRGLVGIALGEHFGTERWIAAPGIDVSGSLTPSCSSASSQPGLYVGTSSRLGMTRMVVLMLVGSRMRARRTRTTRRFARHRSAWRGHPHLALFRRCRDRGLARDSSAAGSRGRAPWRSRWSLVFAVADGSGVVWWAASRVRRSSGASTRR